MSWPTAAAGILHRDCSCKAWPAARSAASRSRHGSQLRWGLSTGGCNCKATTCSVSSSSNEPAWPPAGLVILLSPPPHPCWNAYDRERGCQQSGRSLADGWAPPTHHAWSGSRAGRTTPSRSGRRTARGDQGRRTLMECVAPQSEVNRFMFWGDSPRCDGARTEQTEESSNCESLYGPAWRQPTTYSCSRDSPQGLQL